MTRPRCNARLTAGWLSKSRDAAAVTLFSSAIAANVIRRFKSTWRSFSRRMWIMIIMHEPNVPGAHLAAGDQLHLYDLAATDLQQARRAFELRYWAALALLSMEA